MPRADSKHLGAPFYSSSSSYPISQSPYLSDSASASPQLSPASQHSTTPTSQSSGPAQKKKHVCATCDRPFSTSGHLARHSRVHTGERNHKCPFPGCETRCSRQDNLQQHYRIHLSPGSRRSSTRSAISRAMNTSTSGKRGNAAAPTSPVEPPASPPPLSAPPALEPARVYSHHSTPPDSPPPLAQATLPATAQLPSSSSSRSSSSPEASYPPSNHHHLLSMSSQVSNQNSQSYNYRSGATTYQEQSQNQGFTYVHTTAGVPHSSNPGSNDNGFSSYSGSHNNYGGHSLPHISTSSHHMHETPNQASSRHSISHISHPNTYSQNQQSNNAEPASPASSHSVSSHTSGPPTPSYVYHDDTHAYHHGGNSLMSDQSGLTNGHMSSHESLVHHGYSSSMGVPNSGRFDSPRPTLAPIQEQRYIRRDDTRHASQSSYLHPMSNDYQYHQSMALSHGAWKADGGLRKGVGALVQ